MICVSPKKWMGPVDGRDSVETFTKGLITLNLINSKTLRKLFLLSL